MTPKPLPSSWTQSVADWFAALDRQVRQAKDDRAAYLVAQKAVDSLPVLLNEMDVEALADWFEEVFGGYALAGAMSSKAARGEEPLAFLSADPDDFGITLAPFADAVAMLDEKLPIASSIRSAEWGQVSRELRNRAQFSAGVESVQLLNEIQTRARRRLSLETEKLGNGNERFENRDTFISEVREMAQNLGIDTTQGPGEYGTIKDIRSNERLALIHEMQTSQMAEAARRKADLSKVPLNLYPAYRFQRVESRDKPRGEAYWQGRWSEAGQAVAWEGASEQPMVALKTSPIWAELSRFGNPHPPFDYNSGMGTVDVDRETAVKLDLLQDDDVLEADPEDINDGYAASVEGVDPEMQAKLKAWFGDQVKIQDGEAAWDPNGEAPAFEKQARREAAPSRLNSRASEFETAEPVRKEKTPDAEPAPRETGRDLSRYTKNPEPTKTEAMRAKLDEMRRQVAQGQADLDARRINVDGLRQQERDLQRQIEQGDPRVNELKAQIRDIQKQLRGLK
jgi:hypothetical protein